MPANEEMLPKSKVEAPSCVLGGGQVGFYRKQVHTPLAPFCTSREHQRYLKGRRWGNGELSQFDTVVLGETPSLAVNAAGKTVQRQHGNQCYHTTRKPSTEPTTLHRCVLRQRVVGREVPDGGQQSGDLGK